VPRIQSVTVDPVTLYWLRTRLVEYLKSSATPKAQRALTMVREICDHYLDGKSEDEGRVVLILKERS
jgi:hypothetical protein